MKDSQDSQEYHPKERKEYKGYGGGESQDTDYNPDAGTQSFIPKKKVQAVKHAGIKGIAGKRLDEGDKPSAFNDPREKKNVNLTNCDFITLQLPFIPRQPYMSYGYEQNPKGPLNDPRTEKVFVEGIFPEDFSGAKKNAEEYYKHYDKDYERRREAAKKEAEENHTEAKWKKHTPEWLHTVANSLGSPLRKFNMSAGSYAANTQMAVIENHIAGQAGLGVEITAYHQKGTLMGEWCTYKVLDHASEQYITFEIDLQRDWYDIEDYKKDAAKIKDFLDATRQKRLEFIKPESTDMIFENSQSIENSEESESQAEEVDIYTQTAAVIEAEKEEDEEEGDDLDDFEIDKDEEEEEEEDKLIYADVKTVKDQYQINNQFDSLYPEVIAVSDSQKYGVAAGKIPRPRITGENSRNRVEADFGNTQGGSSPSTQVFVEPEVKKNYNHAKEIKSYGLSFKDYKNFEEKASLENEKSDSPLFNIPSLVNPVIPEKQKQNNNDSGEKKDEKPISQTPSLRARVGLSRNTSSGFKAPFSKLGSGEKSNSTEKKEIKQVSYSKKNVNQKTDYEKIKELFEQCQDTNNFKFKVVYEGLRLFYDEKVNNESKEDSREELKKDMDEYDRSYGRANRVNNFLQEVKNYLKENKNEEKKGSLFNSSQSFFSNNKKRPLENPLEIPAKISKLDDTQGSQSDSDEQQDKGVGKTLNSNNKM